MRRQSQARTEGYNASPVQKCATIAKQAQLHGFWKDPTAKSKTNVQPMPGQDGRLLKL